MSFLSQVWGKLGQAYRAEVGKRLASRGLMYEDLLVETADVKLALSRLPKDVLAAREQRSARRPSTPAPAPCVASRADTPSFAASPGSLKRALVLSSQQRYLPDEVADQMEPFKKYLAPYIAAVEEEKKETARAFPRRASTAAARRRRRASLPHLASRAPARVQCWASRCASGAWDDRERRPSLEAADRRTTYLRL